MQFQLDIHGYYLDESRKDFPCASGLYFVYRGVLNSRLKHVTLTELLYIGESSNINDRIANHEKRGEFLARLENEEALFYSFAYTNDLTDTKRKRIEASLIYELRPPLNIKSTEKFEYDKTIINVIGDRHAYVPNQIIAPTY